jgi:hypothetical protein
VRVRGANQLNQKRMSSTFCVKLSARALALTALALAGDQAAAAAQSRLCTVIQPGETASLVARRMTGEASRTREPWFQIVDPDTSRVVPKESYDYVRAGWNACVVTSLTRTHAPAQSADSDLPLWILLFASIALMTYGADRYFRSRRKFADRMQQFGARFVQEFERPLIRPDSSAPIQSRFRVMPLAARLDIFITPGAGHRYPNLADHRKNVEYDVKRVLTVLRDQPFVESPPYMHGRWVVLPFQWKPGIAEAGEK